MSGENPGAPHPPAPPAPKKIFFVKKMEWRDRISRKGVQKGGWFEDGGVWVLYTGPGSETLAPDLNEFRGVCYDFSHVVTSTG